MHWYLEVLKKYATFSGRARRKEYWMFLLVSVIVSIVLTILDVAVGMGNPFGVDGPLSTLYNLAVLLPSLAVAVRRLHDTDRSGWWVLIGLIPFIGIIVLIIFAVQEGTSGDNQYGADPKAVAA